jgi:hypothetical protein
MSDYLLISSDDPFESRRAERPRTLVAQLTNRHASVSVYLVQNAVLGARRICPHSPFAELASARVELLVDDFSLRERGIDPAALLPGMKPASVDTVITRLASGCKTLWS